MSYYLFFYDPQIKALLLKELHLYHPQLKLSFSNKEFLSMKGPENYSEKLKKVPVIYAKRMGLFLEKKDELVSSSIEVRPGEFWHYEIIPSKIDTYSLPIIDKPELAPARAWHKMQEAHSLFQLNIVKDQTVVEIGSAPGGISFYLLNIGVNLIAIDPAKMDFSLKKNYPELLTHLRKSVFDVDRRHLPKNVDWLISDLNLMGDLNLSQCRRLVDYYSNFKGGFFTIKTPEPRDVKHFENWKKLFIDFNVTLFHLPSHRREIGMVITPKK